MSNQARAQPEHGVYAELFGKGGLWGLGYDHRLHQRFSIGVVGSTYRLHGERVISLSPYLGIALTRVGSHSWFADVGPQVVHTRAHSPIPEWKGESSTGVGAEVSTGYEYRSRLLVRVFVQAVVGGGGLLPWLGTGVGCAF